MFLILKNNLLPNPTNTKKNLPCRYRWHGLSISLMCWMRTKMVMRPTIRAIRVMWHPSISPIVHRPVRPDTFTRRSLTSHRRVSSTCTSSATILSIIRTRTTSARPLIRNITYISSSLIKMK